MPTLKVLHIIEPALYHPIGHLFSFFENICSVSGSIEIHIYADRRFEYKTTRKNIHIHPYFIRKIRKWQTPFLFRKLVRSGGKILFPTAETTDLISAKYFSGGKLESNSVFLFFHLINIKQRKHNLTSRKKRKEKFYSEVARTQPNLVLITPTETPLDFLKSCGFQHVHKIPYPVNPADYRPQGTGEFSHLLLSGDPNLDKGLQEIANYILYCVKNNISVPFHFQTRKDIGTYPEDIRATLNIILKSGYTYLKTFPSAIDYQDYRNLYTGAISLQLYDRNLFSDRASGVALDALLHGAPSIAKSKTWNAKLVERFNSGIVIEKSTPEEIHKAVNQISNNYSVYSKNATIGGRTICKEYSMKNLIDIIFPENP